MYWVGFVHGAEAVRILFKRAAVPIVMSLKPPDDKAPAEREGARQRQLP